MDKVKTLMEGDLVSRPYVLDEAVACERCVFGHGEHAVWCLFAENRVGEDDED